MQHESYNPVYTIGHSNHPLDEFIALLRHYRVTYVADIRAFPYSKRNREYDGTQLAQELKAFGIKYEHFRDLGGRRPKSKTIPTDVNAFWRVQSFHNYADYALSPEFHHALNTLQQVCRHETVAIMCAEVLWWRCHRRIVTDYLLMRGLSVSHIISSTSAPKACLTPEGVVVGGEDIFYPATSK